MNSACAGPVKARPKDGPSYCQRTCNLKYDGYIDSGRLTTYGTPQQKAFFYYADRSGLCGDFAQLFTDRNLCYRDAEEKFSRRLSSY
ncbi:hypothetical protein FYL58_25415 [Klebsiella aerogenes]|nr:hypothetical protein [Klebsiella aerogenes]EIW9500856.1 hypothetical protein [Klebsiella aerogenes]